MQKSHVASEWVEDPVEERLRDSLLTHHAAASRLMKRQLYPLTGKVLPGCTIYGVKPGDILEHVRTKDAPAGFPIEAMVIMPNAVDGQILVRRCSFRSDEIELIGLGDDAEGVA